jgi:hypothetical protein
MQITYQSRSSLCHSASAFYSQSFMAGFWRVLRFALATFPA